MANREQESRAFSDRSPDIIARFDRNLRYLYISSAVETVTGNPPEHYLGKTVREVGHSQELLVLWEQTLAYVFEHGKPAVREFAVLGRNGEFVFEARLVPELGMDGRVQTVLTFSRDVTVRRRAEEQLRLQSSALQSADNAIFITDAVGAIQWVNPAFTRLTGYAAEEVVGRNPRILKSGRQPEGFYRSLWDQIMTGKVWQGEVVNRHKDGSEYIAELTITPVHNEKGGMTHYIAIEHDVTARRAAEDKVRQQAQLLDLAQDAIAVQDLDGTIRFWNRGAEHLYGWTSAEVVGGSVTAFLFREPQVLAGPKAELLAKGTWHGELRQQNKIGQEIIVDSRWTLLRDAQGQPKAVLAINTDITERRHLQSQLQRAQRLEELGRLAGGVAHDLNNILSPILLTTGLLHSMSDDPESMEMASLIEANARRGAEIVRQLLTFARGMEGTRVVVQPSQLAGEIVRVARETFPKDVTVLSQIPEGLWGIQGDPTQVHQVLLNLTVNARDAMPGGGNILVRARNLRIDEQFAAMNHDARPGPYVVLSVSDTGTGIAPEIMDRIFDPFFTTKEIGKGTGLGLAMVAGIVKSHFGFINVRSQVGHGTTFDVYLPAHPGETASAPAPAPSSPRRGNQELVMVVDDEQGVRLAIQRTLERHGYRVVTAGDGAEALDLYLRHREAVQLIVTDIRMPIMDGVALTRAVRGLPSSVGILAVSGDASDSNVSEIVKLGATSFVTKPFSASSLLAQVARLLEQSRTLTEASPFGSHPGQGDVSARRSSLTDPSARG